MRPIPTARGWAVLAGVLLLYAWFVHFRPAVHTANEAARLYFVQAVVDHGTVVLDPVMDRYGLRNPDVVVHEGRRLMDKAPGLSLAAIPVYWVATRVLGLSTELASLPWLYHLVLVVTVALPSVLGVGLLWRLVLDWTGDRRAAWAAALVLALASPFAIYASLFFGHAPATALGLASLWLARRGQMAGSGVAGGAMVLVDTVTAPLAAMIALYGAWRIRSGWALAASALGALPLLSVQLAYNAALFGSPFTFAYAFKVVPDFAAIHAQGIYGIAWPTPAAIAGLLVSPERGLFFHAPALLLGLVGLLWPRPGEARADDPSDRAERLALAAIAGLYLLWVGGFVEWTAGESYGPRHLLPVVPLLALGLGLAVADGLPPWALGVGAAGGVFGAVMAFAPMATWPWAPEAFGAPVLQLALPLLAQGTVNEPSLGSALGWPTALAVGVPAALWLGLSLLLRPPRWLVGAALGGGLACAVALALTPAPSDAAARRRARVECLHGAVDRAADRCVAAGGLPAPGSCRCLAPGGG